MVALTPRGHDRQIRGRFLQRDALPQPSERRHHACGARSDRLGAGPEGAGGRRHVDVHLRGIVRDRRQDSHDLVGAIVHAEDAPHDRRVAAQFPLPVAVAQHEHRRSARVVVGGHERPPVQRRDAQHVEVVGGDHARPDPLWLGQPEQDEPHLVELDDRVEAARGAIVEDFLVGEPHVLDARERLLLPQDDERLTVRIRERLEQDPVHHAEDGGVRADAEPHRADHDECKSRAAAERSQAVADVLRERLGDPREPRVAHVVLDPVHGAECLPCREPRGIGRHAGAGVLLRQHVQVKRELGVEVALVACSSEQRREACQQLVEHGR